MENLQTNSDGQDNRSSAVTRATLGVMLREARERLGFSVADVAAQIKFAPRQIEALEADDFKHLPEAAFLRGFVRSYAKILHLDTQALLALMPHTKADATELMPAPVNVPFPVANSPQKQNLILLGSALFLAVVAVGFAVWHYTNPVKQAKALKVETPVALPAETQTIQVPMVQNQNQGTGPSQGVGQSLSKSKIAPVIPEEAKLRSKVTEGQTSVPSKIKAVKPPATQIQPKDALMDRDTANQPASGPITTIRLVFEEESWTEIKDKDDKILSSKVNPKGSELTLKGHLPLSLVVGHATTTRLYQDGKLVDLTSDRSSENDVARLTLE
jgi:cytoskeleton protein RodZ